MQKPLRTLEKMKLVVFYCFSVLICVVFLKGPEPSMAEHVIQLSGAVGGDVCLPTTIPSKAIDHEIIWTRNDKFFIARLDYKNASNTQFSAQFRGRLLALSNGSLRINGIRWDDGGTYKASVLSSNMDQIDHEFLLTLFEPVSKPSISLEAEPRPSNTAPCKIMAVCSVQNGTDVSYSWRRGKHQTVKEDSKHLLFGQNQLQVVLEMQDANESYSCTAQNPVSHKTDSIRPWKACSIYETGRLKTDEFVTWLGLTASIIVLLLVILTVFYCICLKKQGTGQITTTR
ncbi:SLAM family member 5-like [Protopterus annectens]|uniref:SLAM family member 5-like n=1 Tax=Protopterus annectens TaxID=7888 RepID=UPI001CFC1C0F|nr:SLAM family member 5-like [Protopterus annectens]